MEQLDLQKLKVALRDAVSPDVAIRSVAIEYCAKDRWLHQWRLVLELLFSYLSSSPSPSPSESVLTGDSGDQVVFWCLQLLEMSVDAMALDAVVIKQFISALVPLLSSTSSLGVFESMPAFNKNRLAVLLVRVFFKMPDDKLVELFLCMRVRMLLRVCVAFDEVVDYQAVAEKELLKRILPALFDRLHSSCLQQQAPSTDVLACLGVVRCFVQWCDIQLILDRLSLYVDLFKQREEYSVAVLDLIAELLRKGMPAEAKLRLVGRLQLGQFFDLLIVAGGRLNANVELTEALCRLLNACGCELCSVYSSSSDTPAVQLEAMQLIVDGCLPFYTRVFELSALLSYSPVSNNNDIVNDDNDNGDDDDSVEDINDPVVELAQFSYDLVQIFSRKNDQTSVGRIFQLVAGKISSRHVLLKEYKQVVDLITGNFPALALSVASTQALWPLISLGESKGKAYFVKGDNELTEAGTFIIGILNDIAASPLTQQQQLDFVSKFHFVFNIALTTTGDIPSIYMQLMQRLVTSLQADSTHWFSYMSTINKLIKTKCISHIRNNQQLIAELLNLLFKLGFQHHSPSSPMQANQLEVLHDGFVSIGMLVGDDVLLAELIQQLQIVYTSNMNSPTVYQAIGNMIKGLLSEQPGRVVTAFSPLYEDMLRNYGSLDVVNSINANSQTTDPLSDALIFALIKLGQVLMRCDLELFVSFYSRYDTELFALLQYIQFRFKIVNPRVLQFILEDAVRHLLITRHLMVYAYVTSIPQPLDPVFRAEMTYLSRGLLEAVASGKEFQGAIADSPSVQVDMASQKNILIKSIINLHRKHTEETPQQELEICLLVLQSLQFCNQQDASFIAVLNEMYAWLKQVNGKQATLMTGKLPVDLLSLLAVPNEKDAKKAFRVYFRQLVQQQQQQQQRQ